MVYYLLSKLCCNNMWVNDLRRIFDSFYLVLGISGFPFSYFYDKVTTNLPISLHFLVTKLVLNENR